MAIARKIQQVGENAGQIVSCVSTVEIGDYVCINSLGLIDGARSDSILTMPCVGYVKDKLASNKCVIVTFLEEQGLSGILPKKEYYISETTAGKLQTTLPATGHYVQIVAEGLTPDKRLVNIEPTTSYLRS